MQNSQAVDFIRIEIACPQCRVRNEVHLREVTRDGAVVLFQGEDSSYCQCGGRNVTRFQVAVTNDPEKRPVMRIVPASEAREP